MNILKKKQNVFFVGIKGTGMSSLAVEMQAWGHRMAGSDVEEVFYTDAILKTHGIPIHSPFSAKHIDGSLDLVVYSPAYELSHPELAQARALNIQLYSYVEILGQLSHMIPSLCVAGVHGKSSTASLAMQISRVLPLHHCGIAGAYPVEESGKLSQDLNSQTKITVEGSDSDTFISPDIGIFEACEYKQNFLLFSPCVLIITAIELDHTDVFPDYDSIEQAFLALIAQVQDGGSVLLCLDDAGCRRIAEKIDKNTLRDRQVHILWYGSAEQYAEIVAEEQQSGEPNYVLMDECIRRKTTAMKFGWSVFEGGKTKRQNTHARLFVSGAKMALNTLAAYAGLQELHAQVVGHRFTRQLNKAIVKALAAYRGIKRRSEVYACIDGIWILDDYAHHPTAIRETLQALKAFYNPHRVVVDFMAHTYTRTAALIDGFAQAFAVADVVIVNDIYASAREEKGDISGEALAQAISEHNSIVCYKPDFEEAALCALSFLHAGDIFVSLGAGHSWRVAEHLVELLSKEGEQ